MAYITVTVSNSTGQATKTEQPIQYAWKVHFAELENMWMQPLYI
jgi:hypothetical protein